MSLVAIHILTVPVAGDSAAYGCQDKIDQARSAYYNLRNHGFNGFTATIEPNWRVTLGPTATKENLKIFRALRFSMVVDANGTVSVSHEVISLDKARVEPYAAQIQENVLRLVAGSFGTWARFVIASPFPENETPVKIENSGEECRVFYAVESANIALAMTNDLITEWKLTAPNARRTINPSFRKTSGGLLLNSYKSVFEPAGVGVKTTSDVTIEYQDVEGMKLPHKIAIRGLYGSEPFAAELTFKQYVLNPRT